MTFIGVLTPPTKLPPPPPKKKTKKTKKTAKTVTPTPKII